MPTPPSPARRPSTRERLFETIDCGYQAALDPDVWPRAIRRLADLLGSSGALMLVIDKSTGLAPQSTCAGFAQENVDDFCNHYITLCPRFRHYQDHPGQRIFYDYLHSAETDMNRSPFYDWLQRAGGVRYYIGGPVHDGERYLTVATVQRSRAEGHVQRRDIELYATVLPHLERAVQLGQRLGQLDLQMLAAQEALDRLDHGALVLDEHGRVLVLNRGAEALLRAGDGLCLRQGRLHARREAEDRQFQALLRGAATAAPGILPGGSLRLSRQDGARPYALLVTPLPGHGRLQLPGRGTVAVFIADPGTGPEAAWEGLVQQYGLTRREAELAGAIAAGASLKDSAQRLGIGYETARTHLRRALAKTGTRRQAELVALIAGPAGPAPPPPP